MLICRVRRQYAALSVLDVIETMRPLPVEALAGAPSFVRGLSVVRGVPVPVVDLGALLGVAEPASPDRFVTLRTGRRHVALAVEAVLGVRRLSESALRELPPLLGGASAEAVSAVGTLDGQLLFVLSTARIVPESVWAVLDSHGDDP